jgi:hypothetical protein
VSTRLWGRFAILSILVPGGKGKVIQSFYTNTETKLITDGLRFTFECEKTSESTPNKALVSIYNIAPDTKALLKEKGCLVTLSAGYGNIFTEDTATAQLLFKGSVLESDTVKQSTDYVTRIKIGDGSVEYQNATINQSFAEGASGQGVMSQIVSAMGLGSGEQQGVDGISFPGSLVLSGNARDAMDDVTDKNDLEWSIQDGNVQVLPENSANSLDAIKLSSDTGLIGSPQKKGINSAKKGPTSGIQFVSLLQPGLTPGRRVVIESRDVNGVFVVRKVKHNGDTKSGPWQSECEGIQI